MSTQIELPGADEKPSLRSTDEAGGNGEWFNSVGGQITTSWEFADAIVQPSLLIAAQLDGDEDTTAWITLGFPF